MRSDTNQKMYRIIKCGDHDDDDDDEIFAVFAIYLILLTTICYLCPFCLLLVFYLKRVFFLFLFASSCKQSFNNTVLFFVVLCRTRKIIKKDYCRTTSIIIIIVRYMNEHFSYERYLHDAVYFNYVGMYAKENNKKIHVSLDLWQLIKSYGLFFFSHFFACFSSSSSSLLLSCVHKIKVDAIFDRCDVGWDLLFSHRLAFSVL